METKTESSVPVPATMCQDKQDKYAPVNIMLYRTSIALFRELADDGVFSDAEYRKICTILNKKYGLSSGSIFADVA